MARLKIDEDFVRTWSARYLDSQSEREADQERHLFDVVGRETRERGYFTKSAFVAVGEWKSPRARPRIARNPPALVERITRMALASGDERLGVLMALDGVGAPMASASLSVWRPDEYTVYDVRAVATLTEAGRFAGIRKYPTFGIYLETCREMVAALQMSDDLRPHLRALDRALWKYDQQRDRA